MLSITSHISHDILVGKKITAHKIHPRTWDEDGDYAAKQALRKKWRELKKNRKL
jgi:hypothetical protein